MGTTGTEQPLRALEQKVYGQVEALSHIVDSLAKESSPDRLAEHVLRTTTEQLGAHSCSVWRRDETTGLIYFEFAFEGGKIIGKAAPAFAGMSLELPIKNFWPFPELCPSGKPDLIEDIRLLPPFLLKDRLVALGIITVLMVPMAIAGRLEGAIGLRFAEKRAFHPEELELAQALASQAMLAMQLARLSAESRRVAVMEERNRMARDIHDTLAQGFTGVIVQLEAAKGAAASNDLPGLLARIEQASEVARASLGEARRSVQALRPRALNNGTLFMALDDLLKRMSVGTSLNADFRVEGDPRPLPADWEEGLLRITQESLTNTLKHAGAESFRATLGFRVTGIQLQLVDDGRGFDITAESDGYGLIGMKERVAQIGGQFAIHTKRDEGTEILVTLGATDGAEPYSTR